MHCCSPSCGSASLRSAQFRYGTAPGVDLLSIGSAGDYGRVQERTRDLAVKHPNTVRGLTASTLLLVLLAGWFLYQVIAGLPGADELREIGESAEGTTVLTTPTIGSSFPFPLSTAWRSTLNLISPHLRNAVIAVEDARFYEHDGIDGIRVIGAMLRDVREGRAAEGASTITQQLARVSFLSRDKTLRRKVREAILAQRIEKMYTQGSDSRNLSEQGLLRRWALRRRGGRARILRQAGRGRIGRGSRDAGWHH